MKLRKRFFIFLFLVSFALSSCLPLSAWAKSFPVSFGKSISLTVNDTLIPLDQPPIIENGRTLLPIRACMESLGGDVSWDEENQTVTTLLGNRRVDLIIDDRTAYVDFVQATLDVPARIINGRTLVPVRFVCESFGLSVLWDEASRTVKVYGSAESTPKNTVSEPFTVTEAEDGFLFCDYIDGYQLGLPSRPTLDTYLYDVRIGLSFGNTTLYIYREKITPGTSANSYIAYSNRAVTESSTLTVMESGKIHLANQNAYITTWERPALSRIANDERYYSKIDFPIGSEVYTLFFKSTSPVRDLAVSIAQTFRTTEKSSAENMPPIPTFSGKGGVKSKETQDYFNQVFLQSTTPTWGIFEPYYPKEPYSIKQIENAVLYHFPIVLDYTALLDSYNPFYVRDFLDAAYKDNRVVELTLQQLVSENEQTLYDVLNGKYDAFLREYALAVKNFKHPVLFRPFNEMNGDWCAYSAYHMSLDADLVRELTRYVCSFFKDVGAQNVIYIFNPNGKSFPDFKWNDERLYYPGDEYADVWGITMYNTGTYYKGETWQSFDSLYRPVYDRTVSYTDMPLMITEFACARQGGDKEAWVKDMQNALSAYPNIKAAVWWNHADFDGDTVARDYHMLDSNALCDIWKEYLSTVK